MTSYPACIIVVFVWSLVAGVNGNAISAVCDVEVNSATPVSERQNVAGHVTLQQQSSDGDTTIDISLSGFNATDSNLLHGFHIHVNGDMSDGCQSMGGHYNPFNVNHGGQTSQVRHVGDLGNIEEDSQGRVETTITDSMVSLSGEYSVIGRAIVIHALQDDLGLGGDEGSRTTGNAGARLACCIITKNAATLPTLSVVTLLTSLLMIFVVVSS